MDFMMGEHGEDVGPFKVLTSRGSGSSTGPFRPWEVSMIRFVPLLLLWIALAPPLSAFPPGNGAENPGLRRQPPLSVRMPIFFEENQGQSHSEVSFLSRSGHQTLFLTPVEAVWVRPKGEEQEILRMRFEGARPLAPQGVEPLPGKVHYLLGSDPRRWNRQISTFSAVRYEELYPGIDLLFYSRGAGWQYDFVVRPGADPSRIVLVFEGSEGMVLEGGDLVFPFPAGEVRHGKPQIFQEKEGERREVAGGFLQEGPGRIRFRLGNYDPSLPLVIDPVVTYSTFLGGSSRDLVLALAVDAFGNTYAAGETVSGDFPSKNGAQPAPAGSIDAFVCKLDPTGAQLIFSTFLGGAENDRALDVAVDADGAVYLTGETRSFNFPILPANTVQTFKGGGSDAFVTKLASSGAALVFSTFLGGLEDDLGRGIALDGARNIYIAGRAESANFPVTAGVLQGASGGSADAFVAKIGAAGNALAYSTYLGGSAFDEAFGISVDKAGNAYVVGNTNSLDFPTLVPFQPGPLGETDAFAAKVNPTGSALVYSTYLGGARTDNARRVRVDAMGNAYVVGSTQSLDFPLAFPLQGTHGGDFDVFVSQLAPSGAGILFSTYLGGKGRDTGLSVAVDSSGGIVVAGSTESTDFPLVNFLQGALSGSSDAFVSRIGAGSNRILAFSTYLGGNGRDSAQALALDPSGGIYVAGQTESADFPVFSGFQGTFQGQIDGFVMRLVETRNLYFAHFGNGQSNGAVLRSQITLLNLSANQAARVRVELFDSQGNPLSLTLNDALVAGQIDLVIPPWGVARLRSDGQGEVQVGSVRVSSDMDLTGVVRFEGTVGVAGVGDSKPLSGFVAPMETGPGINTGVAIMNLGQSQTLRLTLRDANGQVVSRAELALPIRGQLARFVTEIPWDTPPDFGTFAGSLSVAGTAPLAATVILVTPGEFATQPVAELR